MIHEEVNEGEDEESGHGDDEEEMDEINHEKLTKTVVQELWGAALPTVAVALTESPPEQYDLMSDLLHDNMFKVYSDMLRSDSLRMKKDHSVKFGYLFMMAVVTLGSLNAESFCESVLSCVKLVVSDLHVRLKVEEIHILVMIRMNNEFMEYMRATYPDTPGSLSEFKAADTYVRPRGGVEALDDDEDDQ